MARRQDMRRKYDRDAVAEFARDHTSAEVALEFGFRDSNNAATWMAVYGISWKKMTGGRRRKGNPVYGWLLEHRSCGMCIDLGWDKDCDQSDSECEEFLRNRLRKFLASV